MNYKKLVIDSGIRMISEGITIGTWGNVSCRDMETGLIYITPSGMPYKDLIDDDIIVLKTDGTVVEGNRKPSIETPMHLAIYRARPEINAVIHTHPIYSTAFSCMGEEIPLFLDETAQVMGDVCRTAKYALPGSEELANNCVEALGSNARSCLLKSHGAVCLGENMEQAFCISTVLEAAAHIYSLIRSMGGQYQPISPENIAAMQHFVKHGYGQCDM